LDKKEFVSFLAFIQKSECIHGKVIAEENCKGHYDKLVALMQEPTSEADLCW